MCPVNVVDLGHDIVIQLYLKAAKRVFQLFKRRRAEDHGRHEGPLHRPGKSHLSHIKIMVCGKLAVGVNRRPETGRDASAQIIRDAFARSGRRCRVCRIFTGQQAAGER